MVLSREFDITKAITMTPLDTLLKEIWQIDPSFHIEYDSESKQEMLVNRNNDCFTANSLSNVLVKAWRHYYYDRKAHDNGN